MSKKPISLNLIFQGESLREDKENHLTLPDLPNLDQPESDPKSNEATQLDVRFGKGLVYKGSPRPFQNLYRFKNLTQLLLTR